MKPSDTLAQIRHLACLGLPSEMVIPPILELFDRIVTGKNSDFVWTDTKGRVANFYARQVDPTSLEIMLHHEHLLNRPGELSFAMHSCSTLMTGNLAKFEALGNLDRTITYNEIWMPNALEQFLDLVIRDETGPRGLLTVGRSRGDLPFTEADTRRIVAIRGWILHAMDTPPRADLTSVETGDEAVILCDHEGRVVQMGPNARKLLLYAGNGQITAGAVIAGVGDAVPMTIRATCLKLAKIMAGQPAEPPQATLKTAFGTFRFRAHMLMSGQAETADMPDLGEGLAGFHDLALRATPLIEAWAAPSGRPSAGPGCGRPAAGECPRRAAGRCPRSDRGPTESSRAPCPDRSAPRSPAVAASAAGPAPA